MGVLNSLIEPFDTSRQIELKTNLSVVNELIDELMFNFATLIADVEEGRVNELVLKMEIEKKINKQKGVFDPEEMKRIIFDTIYGYGILQPLVMDNDISDIDVPHYDYILIKRKGNQERIDLKFENEKSFTRFCKLLITRNGGVINEVDNHCRVSDHHHFLRINVCISPRNNTGTSLNIRKHTIIAYKWEELQSLGFLDSMSSSLLKKMNEEKKNLLICGKGAAGKTTLLRTLIDSGDELERMLICETDSEIYPQKRNAISQKIKKSEIGGKSLELKDLIREGLTMSLDTYCIGEIIGEESWDFIQAGYTDHRIIGTIHGSNVVGALDRMVMLIENCTRIPYEKLAEMIANTLDYVIYLKDFQVMNISRISGFDMDKRKYEIQPIYTFGDCE
ncbi:MAG: hypothetical protein BGO41_09485 [Clostridiales bacterium 38-18]|nr:MAG: hypothetical protein BGO41_09485 [Clostridiales bacterium 38-18]